MNILISGVGGQGTLLTSKVLGKYALLSGNDCKLSEVHGMSQRGGSVTTHVRIGEKIYSPVIWEGGADMIIAFELLEAVRVAHYIKEDGVILVNDENILPMPCISGGIPYPYEKKEELKSKYKNVFFIKAEEMAIQAGSSKATNIVMLGALCKLFDFDKDIMEKAIEECVPPKFLEMNKKAFNLGYENVK
ncbi:MAG: indolepyruvate oxidoreductase subunit beta [Clostridia bacterium]|nr:indolepyruvate oxidoreductase subunit beta [Clostridia bacterium]